MPTPVKHVWSASPAFPFHVQRRRRIPPAMRRAAGAAQTIDSFRTVARRSGRSTIVVKSQEFVDSIPDFAFDRTANDLKRRAAERFTACCHDETEL